MPSVRVTNLTNYPLNCCLKHVAALHFENSIQPGSTVKLKPGKVFFTFEVKVDDGKKSRYSATKSAMTIGIISLAFLATVAAYGAPIALAAEAAAIGGAGAAAGAAASTSALTTTKSLVISQKGNLAKLSSYLIGKSAQKVSDEYGGMSAIQSEVISIIKSPTIDKNFKLKAMETLKDLKKAYKQDKKNKDKGDAESEIDDTESLNSILNENGLISKNVSRIHGLYVKDRMELEVFTLDGKLQIRDVKNDKILH